MMNGCGGGGGRSLRDKGETVMFIMRWQTKGKKNKNPTKKPGQRSSNVSRTAGIPRKEKRKHKETRG